MKTAKQLIIAAKSKIILEYTFYASLLLQIPVEENDLIPTMATDSSAIYYNKSFVEKRTNSDIVFIFLHEIMHIILFHPFRRNNRDPDRWNRACDYAVNLLVRQQLNYMPDDVFYSDKYKDMTVEEIYNILPENEDCRQPSVGLVFDFGSGNSTESGDNEQSKVFGNIGLSESQIETQKNITKIRIAKAANIAKMQGNLPSNMSKLIDEILTPKLNWRQLLAEYVTLQSKNDYCWKTPNNRYIHNDIYLPDLNVPTLGKIVFLVDTSGSISNKEINEIAAELLSLLQAYPATEVEVIWVDSKVAGTQTITVNDNKLEPKGGGGTDFKPGFEYISEKGLDPCFAIYYTDGYCNSFPESVDYPLLWILSTQSNKDFDPPMGNYVTMHKEE